MENAREALAQQASAAGVDVINTLSAFPLLAAGHCVVGTHGTAVRAAWRA